MDLKRLLSGVPWTQNFKVDFTATLDSAVQKTTTPVYALPGRMVDDEFEAGFYQEGSGLEFFPIGLAQQSDFVIKYYHLNRNRKWEASDQQRDGIYYLPLRLSEVNLDMAEENFYRLYTVQGLEYSFPLIFVEEESEEGMVGHGFYESEKNLVKRFTYPMNYIRVQWEDYLIDLERNAYSFSEFKKGADKVTGSENSRKAIAKTAPQESEEIDDWPIKWEDPLSIKAYLDQHVIKQDYAKKVIAVASSNYYLERKTKKKFPRNPLLLIGPTGSGKTLMLSLIARKAGLPLARTSLPLNSGTGFVGSSISDAYKQIRAKTKEAAPYGIFFGDELDKLARRGTGTWGTTLMDELVSQIEGEVVELDYGNNNKASFDTRNLLYFFAGAFHENQSMHSLSSIVAGRLKGEKKIGFGVSHEIKDDDIALLQQVTYEDLVKYGLKPELVARFSRRPVLERLTKDDLRRILKESKSSPLLGYQALFEEKGFSFEVENEALDAIVEACPKNSGARALSETCDAVFLEINCNPKEFAPKNTPKKKITISADLVRRLLDVPKTSETSA
ncbi:AAA family ATPase [Candidatus Woesearchaeota archaeon]|nr:AAA family ATPase [Candidatus Woesearchaeota archaeon]MBI2582494.1 AAA family ATPase [Candidatus Woesearchaeota archaeon]